MGGLIANAIYDATGTRLFQLPMTPDRIKEAMKGSG
jgi:CO/xanthine dehydrogenase Mo-binding subunit